MIGKYKVVHLIGSTKGNKEKFIAAEKYFTKKGYIAFKPVFYDLKENDPNMDIYNDMCYEKLLFCDIVCIVTPNHIGNSTKIRIKQAKHLNKEILVFECNTIRRY